MRHHFVAGLARALLGCGALLGCSALLGCGGGAAPAAPTSERVGVVERDVIEELIAASPDAKWHYDVTQDAMGDLIVEASLRNTDSSDLHVDRPGNGYVRDLRLQQNGQWQAVEGLEAPACKQRCRLRYRFALSEAALQIGDTEVADRHGETILSPPSAWLLRPSDPDTKLLFRVRPAPAMFVTGLWPAAELDHTYVGDSNLFWRAPYSAFGSFDHHRRRVGGADVEVAIAKGDVTLDEGVVTTWLDQGMRSITTYFGRFPVPRAMLIVLPTAGNRVHGKELGGGGASILLWVGANADASKLARDWVGVHEMVHLAHPLMSRRYSWLAEGLATYVEPLARAQAGFVGEEVVWRDMIEGMPKGQPQLGDGGLDGTQSWGRLYWGGALFALVADVEMRRRTGGEKGLQQALRATLARGGHNGTAWSIEQFMKACDAGTGTTVMTEQYASWSKEAVTVDLDGLWAQLGVGLVGGRTRFDDDAPLAHIRKQLTRAP